MIDPLCAPTNVGRDVASRRRPTFRRTVTMLKKLLAALGLTGALYWVTKKRQQGDEFEFSDNSDK